MPVLEMTMRPSKRDYSKELARETLANERALARKDPLIAWAVALQMLAIALELAGVQ
ncbi:MAG TPA: hypothetical protein VGL54_08265 [Solirubrobacteraceae bacterium]|jgi:hypothetical protein